MIIITMDIIHIVVPRYLIGVDMRALYTSGLLLRHHVMAQFYDLHTQYVWQKQMFPYLLPSQVMPFFNPPFVALLFGLLAYVPLPAAYTFSAFTNILLLLLCVYILVKRFSLQQKNKKYYFFLVFSLLFLPIHETIFQGQLSFLLFLGFILAWDMFGREKPFWAGVALSLLCIRPQLVLLPVLLLVWKKQWAALIGFSLASGIFFIISVSMVGLQGMLSYVHLLVTIPSFGDAYTVHPQIEPTLRGFLQLLFHTNSFSVIALAYLAGCVVLLSLFYAVWKGSWEPTTEIFTRKWAILVVLIVLTSMHTNYHDLVFLLFPCMFFLTNIPGNFLFGVGLLMDFIAVLGLPLPSVLVPFILVLFVVLCKPLIRGKDFLPLQKKPLFFIIFFTVLFCILGYISQQGLDPDFGWHLQTGRFILSKGIPKTDPFSYTMPHYPFIDHEWLTDVGIALAYPLLGLTGLATLFILLAYSAILLQVGCIKKRWSPLFILLCITTLIPYIGIRPQIISWVCFSLLVLLCIYKHFWRIGRFFLPLLFLIWVNLHGGFAVGIVVLGIFLLGKAWEKRGIDVLDWLVFLCCIIMTFFNPYTWRMWWEVWVSLADPALRWTIQEWLPTLFFMNLTLILFLPLSGLLVWYARKHLSFPLLLLYVVLLFFGLSSSRNLPFWLILAFPLTIQALEYFLDELTKIPNVAYSKKIFARMYAVYFVVAACVVIGESMFSFPKNTLKEGSFYPQQAINYLHTHPSVGNIFSSYEWGGYLIWKLSEKKVFIDGRMPSWKTEHPKNTESTYAFKEHEDILNGRIPFAPEVRKYHIDTVLLSPNILNRKTSPLEKTILFLLHQPLPGPYSFEKQLQQLGMKVVYKDRAAVIYRK